MTVYTSNIGTSTGNETYVVSNIQQLLKDSTKEKHTDIGKHPFIRGVFKIKQGVSDRAYCQYLVDLQYLHQALEEELERNSSLPYISPLCIAGIYRSKRITADLKSFTVGDIKPSTTAVTYVDHIRKVSKDAPYLLVAHAYVRYLADLSGGQIMQRCVKKLWPHKEMNQFYSFEDWLSQVSEATKISELRDYYRSILNAILLTDPQIKELDKEAHKAYEFTYAMLDEILRIPNWNALTTVNDENLYTKFTQSIVAGDIQLLDLACMALHMKYENLLFAVVDGSVQISTRSGTNLAEVSVVSLYSDFEQKFEKRVKITNNASDSEVIDKGLEDLQSFIGEIKSISV